MNDFRDNRPMQWLRRLFHRHVPRIPDALWRDCVARLPFLQRLPPHDLERLKRLCEALLDKKTFTSAGGLELTDEIAVLIALQASLPVLNLTLDLYDDMAGIIVYPAAFVVPQSEMDEAGVVHEWRAPVSGEALDAGGAVVLSWEDVEASDAPGYNVVIHEFAHKIDMGDGGANGCPPFLADYHRDIGPQAWQREFTAAYEDFTRQVDALDRQLPDDFDENDDVHASLHEALFAELPLDPYAASHPAEFFAVASEAFFVLPQPLADAYPEIYRLLSRYYRQDPLGAARHDAS
ncbi:zinc-dependent peptidase [Noviherbaspirillum cavernae]|uniref:Zinc-dependent peptidase n=2 Tax=Noviherbaspirillum cavernae TaxID=2320862 RepID=A0A418WZD0_9BURK|nr:zinc-dependent peptidase [Noviherbaspirillum cavernae]